MAILFQEFLVVVAVVGSFYTQHIPERIITTCVCLPFDIESGFSLIFLMFWPKSGIPASPTLRHPPPPRTDVANFIRFISINLKTCMCVGLGQKRGKPVPPPRPMLTPNCGVVGHS